MESLRKLKYQGLMCPIYLDHNATTPLCDEARNVYQEALASVWGNPSSLYAAAQAARHALEQARRRIGTALNASGAELFFTSGGTESINWVLQSLYWNSGKDKTHFVTSPTEHHATLRTLEWLRERGADVTLLSVDRYGRIDLDELRRAIRPDTLCISLMAVNNETGLIHPVTRIANLAREHGVFFHCDAVCAVGKLPVDFFQSGVDFLSFSAHKFYGPKGIGGLIAKKDVKLSSFLHGGSQEQGRRAGTENVPAALAMAEALRLAEDERAETVKILSDLRERLIASLTEKIPAIDINTAENESVANTLNVTIPGLDAEAAVIALDLEGIALSTGSACSSGAIDPSHVLMAMGKDARAAKSSLRFSLGRGNTALDIDTAVDALTKVYRRQARF